MKHDNWPDRERWAGKGLLLLPIFGFCVYTLPTLYALIQGCSTGNHPIIIYVWGGIVTLLCVYITCIVLKARREVREKYRESPPT